MASLGDVWHVPYIVLASLYALVLIWATLQLVKLSFLSTALVGSPPNMKMRYELCISSVGGKRRVDCRGRFGTKSLFHALLALSAAGACVLGSGGGRERAREGEGSDGERAVESHCSPVQPPAPSNRRHHPRAHSSLASLSLSSLSLSLARWLARRTPARVASFVCECVRADMLGEPPKSPMHFDFTQWWLYVLGTIPPLLFFSVVTLLVTFWTQVWVDSNELAAAWVKAARVACACCNVALYLGNVAYAIAVYAVWPAEDGGAPDEVVPLWLYVAAFAMVSFGCLVVGWVIHRELNKVPIRLAIRTRKVRQVFIVTFVTFICFFARAIAVAVLAALPKSDLDFSPVVSFFSFFSNEGSAQALVSHSHSHSLSLSLSLSFSSFHRSSLLNPGVGGDWNVVLRAARDRTVRRAAALLLPHTRAALATPIRYTGQARGEPPSSV